MSEIKKINFVFLASVMLVITVSYLNVVSLVDSYVGQLVISQLVIALPSMLYLIFVRKSYTVPLRLKRMKVSNILLCVLFFILIRPVLTFINTISLLYSNNTISLYMFAVGEEVSVIPALIVIAIMPAIFEESVYRGMFYNEYSKAKPLAAMLLSALLFALMHGNLNQFTYAFFMGIVFSLLIEATDSLLSTMVLHFLTNASSVILVYAVPWLLGVMEELYNVALVEGDSMTAQLIENSIGTTDFSVEGFFGTAADSLLSTEAILATLQSSFFSAAVSGLLAFFVFRLIARRSGRWDYIRMIFSKQARVEYEMRGQQESFNNLVTGERLFSLPLAAAIVLLTAEMVLFELSIRGIISI